MVSSKVREAFCEFFKSKDHPIVPSSPLIPYGDPTLLFTTAGMVQFKAYFLGLKKDLKRAASCQKCFRTTDIDNVGKTVRHLTFFEMLGNFSFGDYFKEESLRWGWEFLTEVLGIDPSRLWFSYYKGGIAPKDEEAYEIWRKILPLNLHSHIFELGEDNFWSMGDTGPSGPSSEIYYDRGEIYHPNCPGPWCGCDRYIEIWNHVFTQFDKQSDGSFKPLPQKNIDTGMGLERVSFIVERKFSPFETTLFFPIIKSFLEQNYERFSDDYKRMAEMYLRLSSDESYYQGMVEIGAFDLFIPSLRVIADHIKGAAFLISEGVIPSNEGRGYILRRLIRRASRYARILGVSEPSLYKIVDGVGEIYGDVYNEITRSLKDIKSVVEVEERVFWEMLEKGEKYINQLLEKGSITGKDAFWIYETYGFPYELIKEIASKKGIEISDDEFKQAREKAREVSRKWSSQSNDYAILEQVNLKLPQTVFSGYEKLQDTSKLIAIIDLNGEELEEVNDKECFLVFERTPFYAESGGQVADTGVVLKDGKICAYIKDVQKPFGDVFYHLAVIKGVVRKGEEYILSVDSLRRKKIASNHTATHLINAGLRMLFGERVVQAGSLVSDEKFRFDYTLQRALSPEELRELERIVNNAIVEGYKVFKETRPLSDAKKLGAVLLPGERYSDPARFVLINHRGFEDPFDRFSLELCGGTHVDDLKEVFAIKIIKEGSISRGVRRIEGVSGYSLLRYLELKEERLKEICVSLECDEEGVLKKIEKIKGDVKSLEDKLKRVSLTKVEDEVVKVGEVDVVFVEVGQMDLALLRATADKKKAGLKNSIVFTYGISDGKISFVFTKTSDVAVSLKNIFSLLKDRFKLNGGGRDDFIQGGGRIQKIDELKKFIVSNIR